jgi:hypothetical protein
MFKYSGLRGRGEVTFQKLGLVGLGCGLRGREASDGLIWYEKILSDSLFSWKSGRIGCMVRLGTLGEGVTTSGVVLSGIWLDFESSSDERVRVNFINGSSSSASGRIKVSSMKALHEGLLEERRGERGSGTFNATHCGVLRRGMGLRAMLAEER